MKTIKHITIALLLFVITNGFSQKKTLKIIQKKYHSLLEDQNKGIGVLIKKNGKISTLQMGKHQLTSETVFNIGSATKTFTSILFLQEMEKGNLKLSDSIGMYLSPIKNVDGSLTIETLLSHESGLDEVVGRNIRDIYYSKDDALLNSNLLDQIEENDPKLIGKFDYCNTNYLLLGKIIEKITDKNYFDLLRERIIEPLNLQQTYPYVSKSIKNLATPYSDGKDISAYLDYRYFANIANSAGSIASTLADMEIFYTSLFETELLLKKESLKLMMTAGNDVYGLGLFKPESKDDNYYGHGGNNIGYSFRNGYNPKTKNLYLLFCNERSLVFKKSITKDINAFFNNETVNEFKNPSNSFKMYAGKYLLKEANLVLEFVVENNKMFLVSEDQGSKSRLFQKDENTLFDTQVGASLTVIKDNNKALTFSQNGFTTTIKRIEKDTENSKPKKTAEISKIDVSFDKYIGKFIFKKANLVFEIVKENNEFFLVVAQQNVKSKLFQKNATTLYEKMVGANLEIVPNNSNELTFSQNGFTTTLTRVN